MWNQSEMLKYPGRISKWPTPIPTSACGKDALNALSIFSYPLRLVPKVNHFALEWFHCIKQQLHHRLPHCTPDRSDLYDHGLSYFRKKYGWIWRLQPIPQITTVKQLVVGPPAACQSLSFINQFYLRKKDNYWKTTGWFGTNMELRKQQPDSRCSACQPQPCQAPACYMKLKYLDGIAKFIVFQIILDATKGICGMQLFQH